MITWILRSEIEMQATYLHILCHIQGSSLYKYYYGSVKDQILGQPASNMQDLIGMYAGVLTMEIKTVSAL